MLESGTAGIRTWVVLSQKLYSTVMSDIITHCLIYLQTQGACFFWMLFLPHIFDLNMNMVLSLKWDFLCLLCPLGLWPLVLGCLPSSSCTDLWLSQWTPSALPAFAHLQGAASKSSVKKFISMQRVVSCISWPLPLLPRFVPFLEKAQPQCCFLHALLVSIGTGPFHRVLSPGPHVHESEEHTEADGWVAVPDRKGQGGMAWHWVHFRGIYLEATLGWD